MAMQAVQPDREPITLETVFERIQGYIDRNEYPLIAAERVIRDLCVEGRQDELLTLFWPTPVFEAWQHQTGKSARGSEAYDRLADSVRKDKARRAALKAAATRLESLVEIDGAWKRLGDLDRASCLKAAGVQKRKALDTAHRARFYHAIAQKLTNDQTVRDALDEDALADLFTETGR
jgi:hypothetical protein